jgi:hypothetical protein
MGAAPMRVWVETGPPHRPVETTIRLNPGHRINGRVVDEKKKPLEGVSVYFAHGNRWPTDGGSAKTDQDGRFRFDSLPDDSPFTFVKAGYSDLEGSKLPLDTDEVVTVVMLPAGVIRGKVLDAKTGKPIRAFNVRLNFSAKRQPGEPSNGLWSVLVDPGQDFQSEEGRFQLGDLVVGMPLQVSVAVPGYERAVAERVVAARPNEAGGEEYRLNPLDPAILRTYRGRLLDIQGRPIEGAQLRLIAARGRNAERRHDFPFNWSMIENGQLARQANVTRFLKAVSDSEGRFEFTGVPRSDEAELVWWGRGVSPGRSDHLERLSEKESGSIDIATPMPARIVGTLDAAAFVGATRVRVATRKGTNRMGIGFPEAAQELKPGQTSFEIGDLAPGEYSVSLMGPNEPSGPIPGGMISRPLATRRITLEAGESLHVDFRK